MVAIELVMARIVMIVVRAGGGWGDLPVTRMGPVGIQAQFFQDVGATVDARQNQLHGEYADNADGW